MNRIQVSRSPQPRRRVPLFLTFGLLAFLAASACDCGAEPPGDDGGTPSGDSGQVDCPEGSEGCACLADDTCNTDLLCSAGTCAVCVWGSTGCPCTDTDTCDGNDTCDDVTSACREPTACENEGCAQHQVCTNPGGGDAACQAECETGWEWNAGTSSCDAVPSCNSADPGYLTCDEGVACVDDNAGVRCEGCDTGYVEFNNACVAEGSCGAYCGPGRNCQLPDDGGPALCLDCEEGYVYDSTNDVCIRRVTCDDLSCGVDQVCIAATPQADAECRDQANCPAGQVDPGTGSCVACVHCYSGANLKEGVTGIGNGGYADGSICVCELEEAWFQSVDGEVKRCDADGDGWVNDDLEPVLKRNNGDNPFADNQRCDVREVVQFELVADVSSVAGVQAQDTRVVTVDEILTQWNLPASSASLDSAGRRYVRLIEPEALDDPDLFEARYAASGDPQVYLRPYQGYTGTTITPPDAGVPDGGTAPDAGAPDPSLVLHHLTAAEVNPLTKWCSHDSDDLNLDTVRDVVQSHDVLPQDFDTAIALDNTPVFYRMTYFLELNRGYWRDRTAACSANGETPCHHAYVIKEKSRVAGPSDIDGLELGYVDRTENGFDGTHWQQCVRSRDPDYTGSNDADMPINMDFGAYSTDCTTATGSCLVETDVYGDGTVVTSPHVAYDGRAVRANAALVDKPVDLDATSGLARWPGMNHHSQFKCISSNPTQLDDDEKNGRSISVSHDFNDCKLEPRIVEPVSAGADAVNPRDPYLNCTQLSPYTAPQTSYNHWVSVLPNPSVADSLNTGYQGGCAVEGAEWSHLCAASAPGGRPSGAVNNHEATYGQLFCACGDNRTGATCEIGCPPAQTVSDSTGGGSAVEILAGELVYARTWVCAYPAASHATVTGSGGGTNYELVGEIPATGVPTAPLSGTAGDGTEYTLTAPPLR
jgi:hypothetical protein